MCIPNIIFLSDTPYYFKNKKTVTLCIANITLVEESKGRAKDASCTDNSKLWKINTQEDNEEI